MNGFDAIGLLGCLRGDKCRGQGAGFLFLSRAALLE